MFELPLRQRVRRSLVLGSESPTYYQSEAKLTKDNIDTLRVAVKDDPEMVLESILWATDVAPRNTPAILATALLAKEGGEARQMASKAFPKVIRTGTHLYQFMAFYDALGGGWGRKMRTTVAGYFKRHPDQLATHAIKYRQREGWTYRDVLRQVHPQPISDAHRALFQWMANHPAEMAHMPQTVKNYTDLLAGQLTPLEGAKRGLPWEAFSDEHRKDPELWKALLPTMPVMATVRNLSTMARLGVLHDADVGAVLVAKLNDPDNIARSRIHPVQLADALLVHRSGGTAGRAWENRKKGEVAKTYTPHQGVLALLEAAIGHAFTAAPVTGKRLYVALDVSGSMDGGTVGGSALLTPRDGSALMALQHRKEEHVHFAAFSDGDHDYRYTWNDRIKSNKALHDLDPRKMGDFAQTVNYLRSFPYMGTDCALPMLDAMRKGIAVDAFIIYTDNETWAGGVHPVKALEQYRNQSGIDAKLVVVGMTATKFTIADPNDPGMLDVVGLSSDAISVIHQFIKGWDE